MRIRWTAGSDSCTPYGQNCGDTGREAEPGMESPVQAGYQGGRQIPLSMGRRDADRNEVGKPVSCASRKAAIVYTVPVP